MKTKILGLLAVGLLAGTPAAHSADLVYDFDSSDGGFAVETPPPPPDKNAWATPWAWNASSGSWQVNQAGNEVNYPMTSYLTSPSISLSGALAGVSFVHRWSMETGYWDGGAFQYSINGAAFATAASGCFTSNGYNGSVLAQSASVLAGQEAFVLNSPGFATPSFVTSTLGCLNASAGDTLQVRFLYAGDSNTSGPFQPSWEINSVRIDVREASVPEPGTLALLGLGLAGLGLSRRR